MLAEAGRVSFIEDEVGHGHDRVQPLGQGVVGGHHVRDPGAADLGLGADEALGQGRNGKHERPGDLLGGEAAERTQRQRDLGLRRERGMATGEDEAQPVVVGGGLVLLGQGAEVTLQLVAVRFDRASRRSWSMALWRAADTSQATGFPGAPSRGQVSTAAANASWTASSDRSKSPTRRITVARIRP